MHAPEPTCWMMSKSLLRNDLFPHRLTVTDATGHTFLTCKWDNRRFFFLELIELPNTQGKGVSWSTHRGDSAVSGTIGSTGEYRGRTRNQLTNGAPAGEFGRPAATGTQCQPLDCGSAQNLEQVEESQPELNGS